MTPTSSTRARMMAVLARRRVPLGFAVGLLALILARPTTRSLLIGTIVAVIGEALRIWAAGHLEKGREVTGSGPYRLTRHPLYLGSAIIGVGLAAASSDWWVAALVLSYLTATLAAATRTEEAHLTEKFGRAYPDYRDGLSPPADRKFTFERVMRNREYRAVTGILVVFAVLALKAFTS